MATVSQWRVRLGKHDRSKTESSEQNLSVKTIISHNSYSSSKLTNDIALMELSTPAQINYFVSPVCVSGVDVDTGTNCFTTGWGDTLSMLQLGLYKSRRRKNTFRNLKIVLV